MKLYEVFRRIAYFGGYRLDIFWSFSEKINYKDDNKFRWFPERKRREWIKKTDKTATGN